MGALAASLVDSAYHCNPDNRDCSCADFSYKECQAPVSNDNIHVLDLAECIFQCDLFHSLEPVIGLGLTKQEVRMKTAICMDLETSPCLITCPAVISGAGPQGTSTRLVTSIQPSRTWQTTSAIVNHFALGDAHLAMMTNVARSMKQSVRWKMKVPTTPPQLELRTAATCCAHRLEPTPMKSPTSFGANERNSVSAILLEKDSAITLSWSGE